MYISGKLSYVAVFNTRCDPWNFRKVDLNYKIGNWTYAGYSSAKKTVVVKPKATTIKSLRKSGKKAVKITYKKVSGVSGYQIYMSTKKKSGYKRSQHFPLRNHLIPKEN